MAESPGGYPGDEELLKLAPMGPADQIITGNKDRLPDVGDKGCNRVTLVNIIFIFRAK